MAPEEKKGVILGISPKGLHMGSFEGHVGMNAYKVLYPYSAITAWGTAEGVLSFYLSTRPTQTKYAFALQHSSDAFDLVKHYAHLWSVSWHIVIISVNLALYPTVFYSLQRCRISDQNAKPKGCGIPPIPCPRNRNGSFTVFSL